MPAWRRVAQGWRRVSPPALLVGSFAGLIVIGTAGLLALPGLQVDTPLGVVDALFTMTSAVCVTGLVVTDTATHFTFAGQLWLLLFIQLGGLGLITITTLVIRTLGRRLSLRSEMVAVTVHQGAHERDLLPLVRGPVLYALGVELAGALLLWVAWLPDFEPADAAWHAVFQAVSAFCNAGFSTFSASLETFADRAAIVLTVSLLVVLGGFGYLSSAELVRWLRTDGRRRRRRLSNHTFAALTTTLALLAAGVVCFALSEWSGVLAPLGVADKLVNAWFMAVTPRTAGFNTVPYHEVSNVTATLTLMLMFVGGSPGSTAGGVKTTALAVLIALAASRVRGRRYVELNRRAVPDGTVQRTVGLLVLAFALVSACVLLLSITEYHGVPVEDTRRAFLPLVFEVVSAFGTVGLSMGTTADLTPAGKLVVVALMFIGRVGPLAFFASIALRTARQPRDFRPAQEDLIVG